MNTLRVLLALSISSTVAGCAQPEVVVRFDARVGDPPARCGASFVGVGTTGTTLELDDLRLYVHDVRLMKGEREIPLTLTDDDLFQVDGVALLDFEDGSGTCIAGDVNMNTELHGVASEAGPYDGIRFRVGVPASVNHRDASTAPPPLDLTAMFWGWNGGYKFLRVEGRTTGLPSGWLMHIGSTGCEGDGRGNITACEADNRVEVDLDAFDPDVDHVVLDLASLLSASDLDVNAGGPPGCMATFDDPDCEPIFHGLGLAFGDVAAPGPQRLFSVGRE